jgi:hypothetical protein
MAAGADARHAHLAAQSEYLRTGCGPAQSLTVIHFRPHILPAESGVKLVIPPVQARRHTTSGSDIGRARHETATALLRPD